MLNTILGCLNLLILMYICDYFGSVRVQARNIYHSSGTGTIYLSFFLYLYYYPCEKVWSPVYKNSSEYTLFLYVYDVFTTVLVQRCGLQYTRTAVNIHYSCIFTMFLLLPLRKGVAASGGKEDAQPHLAPYCLNFF